MATGGKSVSVERVIDAPPEKIFDVIADPAQHPVIDGSGSVKHVRGTATRLALGSKFGMGMRVGLPYMVRNTVVEFEEGRRIAWWHLAHNIWRYELEPVAGGTRVVETFDWSRTRSRLLVRRFTETNKDSMEKTLERLDKLVTTGSPE